MKRNNLFWGLAWFAVAFLTFGPTWSGRNGAGVYTTPNTFTAGQTITAAGFNQNFADIATELTNSVAADGQTSMTGPLKVANGTVGAPSISFASDATTGLYRIGGGNIGVASSGSKVVDVASTGVTVTGSVDATTIKQGTFTLVPPGTVVYYAGTLIPDGWLAGDGAAVSRTTYASLFTNISTTYGVGNGTTTFNVPDCTGRVLAGKETAETRLTTALSGINGGTLGAAGGAQSYVIAQTNLPNINFSMNNHTHSTAALTNATGSFGSSAVQGVSTQNTSIATGNQSASNVPSGGSDTPLNSVQPTIVMHCIIKI